MSWLQKLCRDTGLMLHHAVKPHGSKVKQQVDKKVEEKKLDENVTLRRTTIDEIEIKRKPSDEKPHDAF